MVPDAHPLPGGSHGYRNVTHDHTGPRPARRESPLGLWIDSAPRIDHAERQVRRLAAVDRGGDLRPQSAAHVLHVSPSASAQVASPQVGGT